MKVVVTGAAGFIGANVVAGLNRLGVDDVIAVDDLTDGLKYRNLLGLRIGDYFDRSEFYDRFLQGDFGRVDVVLHQGACSDTTVHDGRFMLETNYRCSKNLLDACAARGCRFIYASSAATYGGGSIFREEPACEAPLNVYGYSKFLFDEAVRRMLPASKAQVAGFRYFNVYGPREAHKGRMASVAFHFFDQYRANGKVRLFEGSGGYGPGEQVRDFISVDDVVQVNLFFLDHPELSGIFNVGTGRAETFNDVARATINAVRRARGEREMTLEELKSMGAIEYVPFPPQLVGKYQSYTQADMAQLRAAGYREPFLTVEEGVGRYVERRLAAEAK